LDVTPDFASSLTIQKTLDTLGERGVVAAAHLRSALGPRALRGILAELYCLGYAPNWRSLYPQGHVAANLPTYAWQHQRYWVDLGAKADLGRREGKAHPVLGHTLPTSAARPECLAWERDLGPDARAYPASQVVAGQRRVSSATFARLALAAAKEVFGDELPMVANLELHQPLLCLDNQRAVLQVSVGPDAAGARALHVHSRPAGAVEQNSKWVLHATAQLARG